MTKQNPVGRAHDDGRVTWYDPIPEGGAYIYAAPVTALDHFAADVEAALACEAEIGMAWYNNCSEAERARWHAAAGSAVPADAYRAFCEQSAQADAPAAYTDSTPELSVGDSSFEGWYDDYLRNSLVIKPGKQRLRDAYATGMGDPLVVAAGTLPTYTDDLELRYVEACEERDHLRELLKTNRATPAAVAGPSDALQSILNDADVWPPVDGAWCCLECGAWTPPRHPEAHEHERECSAPTQYAKRRDWKSRLAAFIATAPTTQAEPAAGTAFPHDAVGGMAIERYKVAASDQSMFFRHAVVAGDGTRQLYLGREVECQNMARRFAEAFQDGAYAYHQMLAAAPAHPADFVVPPGTPPLTPDEARQAARNADLMRGPSDTTSSSAYAMAGAMALAKKLAAAPQAPAEAQEPVWDGKLSDSMQKALNALHLECSHEVAQAVSFQVRQECEAIYTSYLTVKRMYHAARDRLEAHEAAQPQSDPFATHPAPRQAAPQAPAAPASKRIGQILNPASEQSQDTGTVVVAEIMSNGYNGQVLWKGKVPPVGTLLYAAPVAAPAAPSGLPSGWVPCILTHDGQHPEEVAYGPQVMMDRLKKWLGRYFELLAQAAPAAPAVDALAAVQALLDVHAELLDANPYAYFELAYTRQTGWMAWITDKPFHGPVINPDRKVLARGQGDTAAAACAAAAQAKEGGAA